jgi:bifunctional non-homologous end joining protein LigD
MTPRQASAAGDERFATYRSKRDFSRTAEPDAGAAVDRGGDGRQVSGTFVVQRHRARRLHYDLRLEIAGALVSWAVPKGPTLDPGVRRLAARTEDHPLEYGSFEGVIPAGEYGGGDVIVWDRGTYALHGAQDAAAALDRGELHVDLNGEKLRGRFVLVRTSAPSESDEEWLLLHKDDEHAEDGWDPEAHPHSVNSGRTNEQVAADPPAVWESGRPPGRAATSLRPLDPDDAELRALDALGAGGTWEFRGRALRLTNLDKTLFPARDGAPAVTKGELVRHYATVSPLLLPLLGDRPVNLHRYPNGVDRPGFWHKAVPSHAPEWIGRWRNIEAPEAQAKTYFVADEPAAIAWLANYGAVELHPWTSTSARPREPSFALFDLDPGEGTEWEDLLVLARLHRSALDHLGIEGFPKVTGRRGIQIWVPVVEGHSFDDTRAWVEQVSRAVGSTVPELVSWEWGVKDRRGLARLDYTQNAINKTLVAPYSARPSPGAPVSVPIRWEELDDPRLRPDRWNIGNLRQRMDQVGDLFAGIRGRAQRLPPLR